MFEVNCCSLADRTIRGAEEDKPNGRPLEHWSNATCFTEGVLIALVDAANEKLLIHRRLFGFSGSIHGQ